MIRYSKIIQGFKTTKTKTAMTDYLLLKWAKKQIFAKIICKSVSAGSSCTEYLLVNSPLTRNFANASLYTLFHVTLVMILFVIINITFESIYGYHATYSTLLLNLHTDTVPHIQLYFWIHLRILCHRFEHSCHI